MKNLLVIAIATISLIFVSNAFGQEQRPKTSRKATIKKPTSVRLKGRKPNSFHIHINPAQSIQAQDGSGLDNSNKNNHPTYRKRIDKATPLKTDITITPRKPRNIQRQRIDKSVP